MNEQNRISQLAEAMKKQEQEARKALEQLGKFIPLFYDAIEQVIAALLEQGVNIVGNPQKAKLDNARESLSFEWDRDRLVFVPGVDAALPDPEVVRNLSQLLKIQMGRLVLFMQPLDASDVGQGIYDICVSPDGSWWAYGLGCPKTGRISNKEIRDLAIFFLEQLVENFSRQWRPCCETPFNVSSSRPSLGFALPSSQIAAR